jgi:hypothetical protein
MKEKTERKKNRKYDPFIPRTYSCAARVTEEGGGQKMMVEEGLIKKNKKRDKKTSERKNRGGRYKIKR